MKNLKQQCVRIMLLTASMLQLLAVLDWDLAYYVMLRILIFACCSVVAYVEYRKKGISLWMFVMIAFAILYNPYFPLHLFDARFWMPINLVGGLLFAFKAALTPGLMLTNEKK